MQPCIASSPCRHRYRFEVSGLGAVELTLTG
jgi:hypothetical protein